MTRSSSKYCRVLTPRTNWSPTVVSAASGCRFTYPTVQFSMASTPSGVRAATGDGSRSAIVTAATHCHLNPEYGEPYSF